MSKQKLVLKYHAAKKEIKFRRYQNGKEVPIRDDSKLRRYMNMRGKFVLQDFGKAFFDDIAKAFDGLKTVNIDVVMTRLDYEDFKQMVEYYNEESNCKMDPTLIAELPDMNQTFIEVVKHGEESISLLEKYRQKLFDLPLENDKVKRSAETFARQMDEEKRNIRDKIDSLRDNNVNLCFVGGYSAGKSALINAILGYRILPEKIKSETAKMFRIASPGKNEPVKIIFEITNVSTEIEWNDKKDCFDFIKGPSENSIREKIQLKINAVKGRKQHEQINELLKELNGSQEVSPLIRVKFPVSLDDEKLQFTIFDTPGTDSNYVAHQNVLMEALEEQRQSILIFVVKPDGLEGEGNNALLHYLKDAENKTKTSIDLGRSLFVINKAETQTVDDRETLQQQEIRAKGDDGFSIKLGDKKLFFVSARYAYAAKAVENDIAEDGEQWYLGEGKGYVMSDAAPTSHCYRENKYGTSEVATNSMLEKCKNALIEAKNKDNSPKMMEICSGLYALENEILVYGEKYASAVKAFAIIDSVDTALSKLSNQADSLKESNQEKITVIENNIRELEETITSAIEDEYNSMSLPANKALPEQTRQDLKIDSDTLQSTIIGHTKKYLNDEIKGWFFGFGKVRFKDKDKELMKSKVKDVIDEFTNNYFSKRKELLESRRDTFMTAVKKTIEENGNISDSAKKVFQDIPKPQITKPNEFSDLGEIYDSHKRVDKVLWMEKDHLDKDGFIQAIEEKLSGIAREMADDYGRDYRNALETLLMQIKSIFESNLETYSLHMKAMIEDKEAMQSLGKKVSEAASSLAGSQETLNKMIWRENKENE